MLCKLNIALFFVLAMGVSAENNVVPQPVVDAAGHVLTAGHNAVSALDQNYRNLAYNIYRTLGYLPGGDLLRMVASVPIQGLYTTGAVPIGIVENLVDAVGQAGMGNLGRNLL